MKKIKRRRTGIKRQPITKSPRDKLLALARELHEKKSKWNNRFKSQAAAKYKISCFKCDKPHCCNQMVMCSVFEAALIAEKLINEQDVQRITYLIKTGIMQSRLVTRYGPKVGPEKWFNLVMGCQLLSSSGKCVVYDIRPSTCANYFVVSDSELCSPPEKEVQMLDIKQSLYTVELDREFCEVALGEYKTRELQIGRMPLGLAVNFAAHLLTEGAESAVKMLVEQSREIEKNMHGAVSFS